MSVTFDNRDCIHGHLPDDKISDRITVHPAVGYRVVDLVTTEHFTACNTQGRSAVVLRQ
jgi:hypothetical protein